MEGIIRYLGCIHESLLVSFTVYYIICMTGTRTSDHFVHVVIEQVKALIEGLLVAVREVFGLEHLHEGEGLLLDALKFFKGSGIFGVHQGFLLESEVFFYDLSLVGGQVRQTLLLIPHFIGNLDIL